MVRQLCRPIPFLQIAHYLLAFRSQLCIYQFVPWCHLFPLRGFQASLLLHTPETLLEFSLFTVMADSSVQLVLVH